MRYTENKDRKYPWSVKLVVVNRFPGFSGDHESVLVCLDGFSSRTEAKVAAFDYEAELFTVLGTHCGKK
jgi:hypothetical protein